MSIYDTDDEDGGGCVVKNSIVNFEEEVVRLNLVLARLSRKREKLMQELLSEEVRLSKQIRPDSKGQIS